MHMVSPVNYLKGCQINFPETVFMREGKVDENNGRVQFLALNDRDGWIKIVTDPEKLRIYK